MKSHISLIVALILTIALSPASASPSRCALLPNAGNCLASFKRYYWDSVTDTCREFTWGGCGGVVPFKTLEQCEAEKCDSKRCLLPGRTGPCKALFTKYYYNRFLKKCVPFTWGGCKGLLPFNTRKACEKRCVPKPTNPCKLKPKVGPCRARIPRYFFDHKSGSCKQFFWGGCRGVVPFKTLKECKLAKCKGRNCRLLPRTGPCEAHIQKWFYSRKFKKCMPFFWGGCKGVVPFENEKECIKSCYFHK